MSGNGTDELNEKLRYAQNLITILQTMLNERTAQAIQLEARIKCLTEDLEKSKPKTGESVDADSNKAEKM